MAMIRAVAATVIRRRPVAPCMVVPPWAVCRASFDVLVAMFYRASAVVVMSMARMMLLVLVLVPMALVRTMSITGICPAGPAKRAERERKKAQHAQPRCRSKHTHSNLLMLFARDRRYRRSAEHVLNRQTMRFGCIIEVCRGNPFMPASELLPHTLPADPMPLFEKWFRYARERHSQPNPDSMVLASTNEQGRPSARVVLCKHIAPEDGYIVFFTNYASRKGRELAQQPHAAAVFHWDALHRQVRMEGRIVRSPSHESDAYFATRALASRIGAWASEQSAPLISRSVLDERVREVAERFGIAPGATEGDVPRPPHWGGFRLWIESIELWIEGAYRVHDRAVWRRSLEPRDEYSFAAGAWEATRLYP